MTNDEIRDYYANLLIVQYLGKAKAYATIQALVTMVIMNQLPDQVQNAYDIGTAVGVQLDVLGKYAGVVRSGYSFTGVPITLTDDDFRSMIRFAVSINNSGSSLSEIQALLHQYFPDEVLVFDYKNMHMSYLISSTIGSQDLIQLMVNENLLPKPMGVGLASIIYFPDIIHFFGFRTYLFVAHNVTPFNTYTDYDTDSPWLSYADSIL